MGSNKIDGIDKVLATAQAASGVAFSSFAILHLTGHMLAGIRYEYASSALFAFRELYHAPAVEIGAVAGGLAVHVAAGLARAAIRQRRLTKIKCKSKIKSKDEIAAGARKEESALQRSARQRSWHRTAGWTLAVFMVGHVAALRIVPLLVLPDPSIIDLTYATYSAQKYPGVFHAYYIALGATGIYHLAYGLSDALKTLGVRIPTMSSKTWDAVAVGLVAAMTSAALSISGAYGPIYMPLEEQWSRLHAKMLSFIGL